MSKLKNFLAMFGGGGNAMPADPMSIAAIQGDMLSGQRDMDLGAGMMGAQYVPNSGAWGALAQVAQAWGGKRLSKKGGEKIADALARQLKLDAEAKAAAEAKALSDEQATYERGLGRRIGEAQNPALNPAKRRDPIKVGNQLVEYGDDGQVRVLHTAPRAPQQAPQSPEAVREFEFFNSLPPDQQQAYLAMRGRSPDGGKPMSVRDQIALRKDKEAQTTRGAAINNALGVLGDMEAATEAGVGGPIAGRDLNPFTTTLLGNLTGGEDIEKFNADASALQDELSRIQRIPGIGTQTDYELRQMMRALPTASMSESTRTSALARIRAKLEALRPDIEAAESGGAPAPSGRMQFGSPYKKPAAAGGWSIQQVD